jgi:hypothetical protein
MNESMPVEDRLPALLRPTAVPPADRTRRRVRAAVTAQRRRHRRRVGALRVVLAVLGLVALSTTIVVAGSADAREALRGQLGQLGSLVGIGGRLGRRITSLQPAPGFTVLQPTDLPDGMLRLGAGYNPGPQPDGPEGRPVARPSGIGVARRIAGVDVDPVLAETASRRGAQLMGDAREPTLVLVYGAPPDRFVELVERPAAGKRPPAGEAVTVRGVAGTLRREGDRDVYAWVEGDAFVELHTTLDRTGARRVIEGLEPTALTTFVPRVVPPVVLPTEVPLAQRRRAVEAPRADWRTAVQPCGAWDPDLARRAPSEAYGHVLCIARAIIGADPAGGYGLSRYRWREAAERLGVDAAAGPAPDAEVWFAQFPEAVVVLDAETAAPYVVVRLAPVDPVVVRTG